MELQVIKQGKKKKNKLTEAYNNLLYGVVEEKIAGPE
jgi:hypothetical protein